MFTVFLAFVIYAEAGRPNIVAGFKTLDDCLIEARRRNLDTLNNPAKPGGGFVCLQLRADV